MGRRALKGVMESCFFLNQSAGLLVIPSSTHCSASPHLGQMTVQYSVVSVTIRCCPCGLRMGAAELEQKELPQGSFHWPEGHLFHSGTEKGVTWRMEVPQCGKRCQWWAKRVKH